MLPSRYRLPKENITEVMQRGLRVTNNELTLRYIKTSVVPRFAFIVSTKVDKRATARNRMRRILSESVRHALAQIRPMDAIIVVRKSIAGWSQKETEILIRKMIAL